MPQDRPTGMTFEEAMLRAQQRNSQDTEGRGALDYLLPTGARILTPIGGMMLGARLGSFLGPGGLIGGAGLGAIGGLLGGVAGELLGQKTEQDLDPSIPQGYRAMPALISGGLGAIPIPGGGSALMQGAASGRAALMKALGKEAVRGSGIGATSQAAYNWADDRPLLEGVGTAATLGGVLGAGTTYGMNKLLGRRAAATPTAPTAPTAPAPTGPVSPYASRGDLMEMLKLELQPGTGTISPEDLFTMGAGPYQGELQQAMHQYDLPYTDDPLGLAIMGQRFNEAQAPILARQAAAQRMAEQGRGRFKSQFDTPVASHVVDPEDPFRVTDLDYMDHVKAVLAELKKRTPTVRPRRSRSAAKTPLPQSKLMVDEQGQVKPLPPASPEELQRARERTDKIALEQEKIDAQRAGRGIDEAPINKDPSKISDLDRALISEDLRMMNARPGDVPPPPPPAAPVPAKPAPKKPKGSPGAAVAAVPPDDDIAAMIAEAKKAKVVLNKARQAKEDKVRLDKRQGEGARKVPKTPPSKPAPQKLRSVEPLPMLDVKTGKNVYADVVTRGSTSVDGMLVRHRGQWALVQGKQTYKLPSLSKYSNVDEVIQAVRDHFPDSQLEVYPSGPAGKSFTAASKGKPPTKKA